MKVSKTLLLFFTCSLFVVVAQTSFAEKKPSEIVIETNFDRGSLGPARIINDSLVKAQTIHWIKKDMVGNQFYWFYFKISNVKGKKIRFEFSNMAGTYRGRPHKIMTGILKPVISYDNNSWDRIFDTHFDAKSNIFTFRHTFEENEAWIAYAHPYPKSRGDELITELKSMNADIEVIGQSTEGNNIHMLTFPPKAKYSPDKKVVLVMALQHASEDCGGYFAEGMIKALQENQKYSEKFIYKIIPMMNPDGLYFGVSRYNYNMEDLNSEWDDDITDKENLPVEPEVLAVKNWQKDWIATGGNIDLWVDIHSHSQKAGDCAIIFGDERLHLLAEKINIYWPIRTNFRRPGSRRGGGGGSTPDSSSDTMNTLKLTMELSQSHNGDGVFLNIDDYKLHGKYFVKTIDEFFSELK
jgi:hypothetical protein